MKRGINYDQGLREKLAYLHGRVERELEAFADSIAVPKVVITHGVGTLLLGIRPWDANNMPNLQRGGNNLETGERGDVVDEVEGIVQSHGSSSRNSRQQPQLGSGERTAETKKSEMSGIKKYWADFTPEQRSRMMKARFKKWKPEAKAAWGRGGKQKTWPCIRKGCKKGPFTSRLKFESHMRHWHHQTPDGKPIPDNPKQPVNHSEVKEGADV